MPEQQQAEIPELAVTAIKDMLLAAAPELVGILGDYQHQGVDLVTVIAALQDGEYALVINGDGAGMMPVVKAAVLGTDREPFVCAPQ